MLGGATGARLTPQFSAGGKYYDINSSLQAGSIMTSQFSAGETHYDITVLR